MTHESDPITDAQVDAYLDHQMAPTERVAFEQRLRSNPEIAREIALQLQIEASLQRLFPVEQLEDGCPIEVGKKSVQSPSTPADRTEGQRRVIRVARVALVGLAAAVAWVVAVWQWGGGPAETPFFQARPLAQVYRETVHRGFEPYYECRDDQRFADTFLKRQGQALSLASLPTGSQMLGLSYAGGLSRDTTAMLCRVDGQPVMVFVDRLENDLKIAAEHSADQVHVHRVARDGLVFYEVTPFDAPRMIDYLVVDNGSAERPAATD
jgi:hypothetical protein